MIILNSKLFTPIMLFAITTMLSVFHNITWMLPFTFSLLLGIFIAQLAHKKGKDLGELFYNSVFKQNKND